MKKPGILGRNSPTEQTRFTNLARPLPSLSATRLGPTRPRVTSSGLPDHRREELFDHHFGIFASSGVNGRRLDRCASRRNQPMKTFALLQLTDRTRIFAAGTDDGNAREMFANGFQIDMRIERLDARCIEFDLRAEKIFLLARDDHADVDEFLAFDTRHDTHDGVVIGALIWQAAPPRQTGAAFLAAA